MARIWTARSNTGAMRCIRLSALLALQGILTANTDYNATICGNICNGAERSYKAQNRIGLNLNSLALRHQEASTPARPRPKRGASWDRSIEESSVLSGFRIQEQQPRFRDRVRSPGEISS